MIWFVVLVVDTRGFLLAINLHQSIVVDTRGFLLAINLDQSIYFRQARQLVIESFVGVRQSSEPRFLKVFAITPQGLRTLKCPKRY
jgi:hypothetical protein